MSGLFDQPRHLTVSSNYAVRITIPGLYHYKKSQEAPEEFRQFLDYLGEISKRGLVTFSIVQGDLYIYSKDPNIHFIMGMVVERFIQRGKTKIEFTIADSPYYEKAKERKQRDEPQHPN